MLRCSILGVWVKYLHLAFHALSATFAAYSLLLAAVVPPDCGITGLQLLGMYDIMHGQHATVTSTAHSALRVCSIGKACFIPKPCYRVCVQKQTLLTCKHMPDCCHRQEPRGASLHVARRNSETCIALHVSHLALQACLCVLCAKSPSMRRFMFSFLLSVIPVHCAAVYPLKLHQQFSADFTAAFVTSSALGGGCVSQAK
jgi:hypothetical protein